MLKRCVSTLEVELDSIMGRVKSMFSDCEAIKPLASSPSQIDTLSEHTYVLKALCDYEVSVQDLWTKAQ